MIKKLATAFKDKNKIVWLGTILFSILFIAVGYSIASKDVKVMKQQGVITLKAEVIKIENQNLTDYSPEKETGMTNLDTIFTCKLSEGKDAGKDVLALQSGRPDLVGNDRPVEVGDKIFVYNYPDQKHGTEWLFGGFIRLNGVFYLGAFFFILLIVFGRFKGLNTVLSLSFTCAAVFFIYIPSILSGYNVYLSTIIIAAFVCIMTMLLIDGWSGKSLATALGCLFGVLVAALMSVVLDGALQITGFVDEHSVYLAQLPTKTPINMNAIIFGGIVIGSLGAVMDVAINIASSLHEIVGHSEEISPAELMKSGMNIGRDIMGTMANTLVLAYIGSSLSTVLLLTTYSSSLTELLNREMIIIELLQALIGSTAILLTIPLTSLVSVYLYLGRKKNSPTRV